MWAAPRRACRICYYSRRCCGVPYAGRRSVLDAPFRAYGEGLIASWIPDTPRWRSPQRRILCRVSRAGGPTMVWLSSDHSGRAGASTGTMIARTNPRSSGPKSDNVDMTVPSNYSAAPSGDLCTSSMRFFGAVRWENRKSVRTRADRAQSGTAVGSPCRAGLPSVEIEILSATRDDMKRGGLHDGASLTGAAFFQRVFPQTVFVQTVFVQTVFHPWKQKVMSNTVVAGSTVTVSSAVGPSVTESSVTRHRHPSGPPRNSFFT